jgi:TRAP-type C4-dicarboxylate transport system substrate-binding protein
MRQQTKRADWRRFACGLALCWLATASQGQTIIKLGTVAPEGSIWHDVLLEIREEWRRISAGEVELRIYAGGVLGGEDEMIRKMQRRGLDALAVSGSGLPLIDSIVDCLSMPLMFEDYAELDAVRGSIVQELEASFRRKGYEVLNWSEAGWVHFFAKEPVRTPDDLRRLRLWIATGDPLHERMARELDFRVVPLPVTDMLTGLQTGLIEVIDVPPLFALLDRSYAAAPYMTDLRFAPLNAATVMTAAAWGRVPEAFQEPMRRAARELAGKLRVELDRIEQEAIADREAWHREARAVYPRLGCRRDYPALYERVMRLGGFAASY